MILMSLIFLMNFSTLMILSLFLCSISPADFFFPSKVDLTNYKSSSLSAIESSSVDSALTSPFVEDNKVTCVSAKVTCITSFLLNVILMLLFIRDRILSCIHNYL